MLVDLMVAVLQKSETIGRSRGLQEFAHAPDVIRDPRCHRRRDSQRLMDPAEIEECEPKRVGCAKVLPLFTEGVREPCHAAHTHPNRKVLSLNMRCTNAGHIGLAVDRSSHRGRHFWWSVTRCAFPIRLIYLHDGGEVHALAQAVRDAVFVGRPTVCGDLKSSASGNAKFISELHRVLCGAASE